MDKMFAKWGGGEVLKKAVRGMLPKNRLRDKRLARLKGEGAVAAKKEFGVMLTCIFDLVFEGLAHPYKDNIVKFGGRTSIMRHLPEVTKSIKTIQSTGPSSTA